jgi:catechol 2,3-dioxygenase-like lactoylglutathione lyase family enzyme
MSNPPRAERDAPRLNHVAMSMDPKVLDEQGRTDVLAFYGEVFGWTEGDNTGERGNPLVLYTGAFGEFVYLLPGDPDTGEHMDTPPLDHFGYMVRDLDELHAIVGRAEAYAERDDRVRIIDVDARTTNGPELSYTLTNAYIGYLLPLMVELQHVERLEPAQPKP